MKQPSVTVLITLRNNAETIRQCIDSVLGQNYGNYDVVVVDAFSTDGSYDILKSFGNKIKLYQLKGWAPKAYNFAIRKIKSQFVALTDADCVVDRNWVKELVRGFESDDVLAVSGFCGTAKSKSRLQMAIGKELEDRFNHFVKYVARAPTMNLCIRRKVLDRIRFNEKMRVAYDTEFGYEVNKIGKMLYNEKAIIYHYHRATWKNLFRQQMTYGEYSFLISMRHRDKMMGDQITNPYMIAQVPVFWIGILFAFLSLIRFELIFFTIVSAVAIKLVFWMKIHRLGVKTRDYPLFFSFFTVRMVAWSVGLVKGVSHYLRER
jgi:glycosyltransferase involved in cell wall biosynthesis